MVLKHLSRQNCPNRVIESKDSGDKKLPILDIMINTAANKFFRETDLVLHRGNTFSRSRLPIRIKIEGKKERVYYISKKNLIRVCSNLWGRSAFDAEKHFKKAISAIRKKTITFWSSSQIDRLTNLTYRFFLAALNNREEKIAAEVAEAVNRRNKSPLKPLLHRTSSDMSPVEMQAARVVELDLFDSLALTKKDRKKLISASYDGDESSVDMMAEHLISTRDSL